MTKVAAVVRKSRINRKNEIKVEIAIYHHAETIYFPAGVSFVCTNKDCKEYFVNGQCTKIVPEYINKNLMINQTVAIWSAAVDKVCNKSLLTVSQVYNSANLIVRRATGANTLQAIANEYIDIKNNEGKKANATYCRWAVDKLVDFLGGDIKLADISAHTITLFAAHMRGCTKPDGGRMYSESYINSNLARIKAIINYAINFGYVSYNVKPFATTKIKAARVRDTAVSVDDIIKLKNTQLREQHKIIARDVWFLSFYLGGANFKDIYFGNFGGNDFCFVRSKTAGRCDDDICIPILQQARTIIDKYIQPDGQLNFGYKFTNYGDLLRFFARQYIKAKKEYKLPDCFCYMSARKSFAQIAADIGISDNVIDYVLGHSINKGGSLRYYRRVTPRRAADAMARVFSCIDNPDMYDKYIED